MRKNMYFLPLYVSSYHLISTWSKHKPNILFVMKKVWILFSCKKWRDSTGIIFKEVNIWIFIYVQLVDFFILFRWRSFQLVHYEQPLKNSTFIYGQVNYWRRLLWCAYGTLGGSSASEFASYVDHICDPKIFLMSFILSRLL